MLNSTRQLLCALRIFKDMNGGRPCCQGFPKSSGSGPVYDRQGGAEMRQYSSHLVIDPHLSLIICGFFSKSKTQA
jgi:hypothetical protein